MVYDNEQVFKQTRVICLVSNTLFLLCFRLPSIVPRREIQEVSI